MLIGAALIELEMYEGDSIKAKRRVVNSIKDRVRQRFKVSIAEVDDQNDMHAICLGVCQVGINPAHLQTGMQKVIDYIDSLGFAELVGEDILVARLDEVEPVAVEAVDTEEDA